MLAKTTLVSTTSLRDSAGAGMQVPCVLDLGPHDDIRTSLALMKTAPALDLILFGRKPDNCWPVRVAGDLACVICQWVGADGTRQVRAAVYGTNAVGTIGWWPKSHASIRQLFDTLSLAERPNTVVHLCEEQSPGESLGEGVISCVGRVLFESDPVLVQEAPVRQPVLRAPPAPLTNAPADLAGRLPEFTKAIEERLPSQPPTTSPGPAHVSLDGLFSAAALMQLEGPLVPPIVEGYLPVGVTVLAGRPKSGKSWLALDLACSVALGRPFLGVPVEQGAALYLALEDSQQRLRARLRAVLQANEAPAKLACSLTSLALDEGGADQIRAWIERHPDARLVVIDVFHQVRPKKRQGEVAYVTDYRAMDLLKNLAEQYRIGILVLHHTGRIPTRDPLDRVLGSTGITGAADAVLIMAETGAGKTLYGRGRDIQEIETALTFDAVSCRWQAVGAAPEAQRSEQRTAILDLLLEADEPLRTSDIAALLDMRGSNVKQLLFQMKKVGEVTAVARGFYVHPMRQDRVVQRDPDNR